MPMPIDFQLTFKDGSKELHYIPMYLMFGQKPEKILLFPALYMSLGNGHILLMLSKHQKNLQILRLGDRSFQRLADIEKRIIRLI